MGAREAESADAPAAGAPRPFRVGRSLVGWGAAVVVVYAVAAWTGVAAGTAIFEDVIPQRLEEDLGQDAWPQTSYIVAADGRELDRFAGQRRTLVAYSDVSSHVIDALVAVEDGQFWHHVGINPRGVARAAATDIGASIRAGRPEFPEGGSSLTQQLAKMIYTDGARTPERKLVETGYALAIEREYRKEEILQAYLNRAYFGHGMHGIGAAAEFYFGHDPSTLTVPEAALLAGLVQGPNALSPIAHPERALARRNHVLDRMVEAPHPGPYLTRAEADAFRAEPIRLALPERSRRVEAGELAPFVSQEVRAQLAADERVRTRLDAGGLTITTTLDADLQRLATRALRGHLHGLEREVHGFRPIERNLVDAGGDPEAHEDPAWRLRHALGDVVPGVVLDADARGAVVRLGERDATDLHAAVTIVDVAIDLDAVAWTRARRVSDVLRRGDVAPFRVLARDAAGRVATLELEQEPALEAALVALDVRTGHVLALVGGHDFQRSRFDKALHARRQVGSTFKPILVAAALEAGLRPSTIVRDEPTVFVDAAGGPPYAPGNYDGAHAGPVTVREALERSLNVPAVRILQHVGPERVITTARSLGLDGDMAPYPSLALGATEATLLQMTSAFGAFANGGLRVEPTFVRRVSVDATGEVLLEHEARGVQAVSPQVAFQVVHLLRGVVERGTATPAKQLGRPVAGKTGTTDGWADAWFVGFTPSMAVGVWVGREHDVRGMGRGVAGSHAALPIWIDFMREALEGREVEPFVQPDGLEVVPIDRRTGLRAMEACDDVLLELFREEEVPYRTCSPEAHGDAAAASRDDSVESLLMADRRTTERGDLGDFDILDGKTVIVVRNE